MRLLDFAWSRRLDETPWTAFRGTMVHLTAPELAAAVTADRQPVLTTPASDVHALAVLLWTCATGDWPLDYRAAGIDRTTAAPADLFRANGERAVPLTPTAPRPELLGALRPVLLAAPADRPTAADLAAHLTALHDAAATAPVS
ncbi:hypothetical protein KCH_66740 [Kitasatospora cheerisanensis KCTC 2395]|uniref:Protein kinase domain-containing protein n=1 Tax=Kitasatospora cheerisanensis KCTC 2395 TaxID=1348663 RepID=A0A066YK92_9ACTN|nr:hypothetical protein KCH_66740 [Kitasatospora cheerisanensis KCTC 2395]